MQHKKLPEGSDGDFRLPPQEESGLDSVLASASKNGIMLLEDQQDHVSIYIYTVIFCKGMIGLTDCNPDVIQTKNQPSCYCLYLAGVVTSLLCTDGDDTILHQGNTTATV